MNFIKDAIMATVDPGIAPELVGMKEGDVIENYTLNLSSLLQVETDHLLAKGPLLLIFIRGTWCPFCRLHMKRVRDWLEKLQNKRGTVIIVSSEPMEDIRAWLEKNPMHNLFASDPEMKMAKDFGVHIDPREFSQAATFLIDTDRRIRLAYRGKRTQKNFQAMQKSLDLR